MDKQFLLFSLVGSLVLIISVFASKATSRFGVPILLIFIGIGMLLGSGGPGGIPFNDFASTHLIGTFALIFILFDGGFSSQPSVLQPIWKEGITLATIGVFLTAIFMTCLIHYAMGWNWLSSAILSAAVSSTDAASVFGILRTQKMEINSRLRSLVELESGSNDPMSVVIILLLIQFAQHPGEMTILSTLEKFFVQISLGGLAGWFLGKLLVSMINWLKLEFEGLYPVLTMAGVLCIYSLTEYCGGNGYLAVFVAGFSMSNEKFLSKKSLLVFHDGLSWLMQVGVFLTMGLLVNPAELGGVVTHSAVFAFGLIFLARPLAVLICLFPFGYRNWREIAFISWGGIKGAVAIILGTYLLIEGVPHAKIMFNVIFFIVIISMTLQGGTISKIARLLGVCGPKAPPNGFGPYEGERKTNEFIEFEIPSHSNLAGKTIFDLNLPAEVLIVLVHRNDDDFIPKGNTELCEHDRLVCLVNRHVIPEIRHLLQSSQVVH
ncbi:MAG: potassium/proton antiporter [Bdellovibrionota bacterium]